MRCDKFFVTTFLFFTVCLACVQAFGPNNLALIVNMASPDSLTLANHYVRIRGIPLENVIYVTTSSDTEVNVSERQFNDEIWIPVNEEIDRRNLRDRILAWAYSTGFPLKYADEGTPVISLQGITLTGGVIPDMDVVEKGAYSSPYYRGPGPDQHNLLPSKSFEHFVQSEKGFPSMVLGHTGRWGNPMPVAVNVLKKGTLGDGAKPRGTIYFVTSEDVRSTCRQWQYADASGMLAALNVRSVISSNYPAKGTSIMGVLAGAMYINTSQMGTFMPGCMAEHLTSFAGDFSRDDHTKVTGWLAAGATASAGAVTEPYALWPKFPSAFFYVHYARGCSLIESFYQSVRCPLQLLMMGEPLSKPWAQNMMLTIVSLNEGPVAGKATFYVDILGAPRGPRRVAYYVDGQPVVSATANPLEIDTTTLSDGWHELRAVTRFGTEVSLQTMATKSFEVNNHGQSLAVRYAGDIEHIAIGEVVELVVEPIGLSDGTIRLYANERIVGSRKEDNVYQFNTEEVGQGPVRLQAGCSLEKGGLVMSKPLDIIVVDAK
ncbi:MAG: hypothetical protein EOM20_02345 [Spartobacteria bacterium]|nr:hypothetical protein [Spartobacteria bacterium]